MFPERFSTDRLRFERLCHENVEPREYADLVSTRNPTVRDETEFLPWNPVCTLGGAADRLDEFERMWEDRERAEWLVRPREGEDGAGDLAGSVGLICDWERDLAVPTIWLRKPFWGRGYSGERADAVLEVAFDRLGVGVVAILTHGDNERSYRAVERYVERHGGRYEGLLRNHAGRYDEPADHHRFSISQEEYEANRD